MGDKAIDELRAMLTALQQHVSGLDARTRNNGQVKAVISMAQPVMTALLIGLAAWVGQSVVRTREEIVEMRTLLRQTITELTRHDQRIRGLEQK